MNPVDLSVYSLVRYEIESTTPLMEDREIYIERKVYNVEAVAFNLFTVGAICSLVLAIFSLLSLNFSCLLMGIFCWLRWDVQRTMRMKEVRTGNELVLQAVIGLDETQASRNILTNFRIESQGWSHTEIRLFGIDLWKSLLPAP